MKCGEDWLTIIITLSAIEGIYYSVLFQGVFIFFLALVKYINDFCKEKLRDCSNVVDEENPNLSGVVENEIARMDKLTRNVEENNKENDKLLKFLRGETATSLVVLSGLATYNIYQHSMDNNVFVLPKYLLKSFCYVYFGKIAFTVFSLFYSLAPSVRAIVTNIIRTMAVSILSPSKIDVKKFSHKKNNNITTQKKG